MRAAITAEYRKLTSTRIWWILLICAGGYLVFMSLVMAFAFVYGNSSNGMGMSEAGDAFTNPETIPSMVYTLGTSMGYVFPILVGTMAMTSEFRYKTITPTLLADPNRTRLIGAKLIANLGLGAIFGIVITAASVIPGAIILAIDGRDTQLGSASTWQTIVLSVVALALWALVGVGLGSILTNQTAAIIVILAFTQFAEPLLRLALGSWEPTSGISRFLPGAASDALAGGDTIYSALASSGSLTWWAGGLVLVAYALVFSAIGRVTTLRKDIG